MTRNAHTVPAALLTNLRYNHVLHEQNVLLSVETAEVPRMLPVDRAEIEELEHGFFQVKLYFGFMEEIDVPQGLGNIMHESLCLRPERTTYFIGRQTLYASEKPGMQIWRESLFIAMHRNTGSAAHYFHLQPEQVIEIGTQLEI